MQTSLYTVKRVDEITARDREEFEWLELVPKDGEPRIEMAIATKTPPPLKSYPRGTESEPE